MSWYPNGSQDSSYQQNSNYFPFNTNFPAPFALPFPPPPPWPATVGNQWQQQNLGMMNGQFTSQFPHNSNQFRQNFQPVANQNFDQDEGEIVETSAPTSRVTPSTNQIVMNGTKRPTPSPVRIVDNFRDRTTDEDVLTARSVSER